MEDFLMTKDLRTCKTATPFLQVLLCTLRNSLCILLAVCFCMYTFILVSCEFFSSEKPYRVNPVDAGCLISDFRPVMIDEEDIVLTWKNNGIDGELLFYANYLGTDENLLGTELAARLYPDNSRSFILHSGMEAPEGTVGGYYTVFLEKEDFGINDKIFLTAATPQFEVKHTEFQSPVINVLTDDNTMQTGIDAIVTVSQNQLILIDFGMSEYSFGSIANAQLTVPVVSADDCTVRFFSFDERSLDGNALDYFWILNNSYDAEWFYYTLGMASMTVSMTNVMSNRFSYENHLNDYNFKPSTYVVLLIEYPEGTSMQLQNGSTNPITLDITYTGYYAPDDPLLVE